MRIWTLLEHSSRSLEHAATRSLAGASTILLWLCLQKVQEDVGYLCWQWSLLSKPCNLEATRSTLHRGLDHLSMQQADQLARGMVDALDVGGVRCSRWISCTLQVTSWLVSLDTADFNHTAPLTGAQVHSLGPRTHIADTILAEDSVLIEGGGLAAVLERAGGEGHEILA